MGKGRRNRAGHGGVPAAGAGWAWEHCAAGSDDGPRDPDLPEFSRRQADALRAHAAQAVRSRGYRARDRGTHLTVTGGPFTGQGAQLGFSTIAREAQRTPEADWAALVDAVVAQILGAAVQGCGTHGSLGYAGPALRERLFPRFVAPERMPPGQLAEAHSYAREVGGLPLILAIRHDQTSIYVADDHLAKAGGPEAAWAAAESNLFAAGPGRAEGFVRDRTAVLLLESDHPRQASWMAFPDRLMAHLGREPGPLGVLFGVPALRMIAVSATEDSVSHEGVRSMLGLNAVLAQDEVAPLSPHVYWWRPGAGLRQATAWRDGRVEVALPEELAELLGGPDGRAAA
jgi:hypothetical protein